MMSNKKNSLFRITTVSVTSYSLLKEQLHFLNKYFRITVVSSPGAGLKKLQDEYGLSTKSLEMNRRISPFADLVSIWKMFWLLKREKPDIVHSMTPKAGFVSMIAAYFAKVPHRIHTFTGLVFPAHKGLYKKLLITTDKVICRFATQVIPEGEGVKKDLMKERVTQKPLKVLAAGSAVGIDPEYYQRSSINLVQLENLRKKLSINQNDLIILYVGRLVRDKGVEELVNAFISLSKNQNNLRLLLIGPHEDKIDPLADDTMEQILHHKYIHWMGHQDDVRHFYGIGDIFALPSYREGFPNVVLEAGAMELPCVVTSINGSNEIVVHGETGLIVPARDSQKLMDALRILINDEAIRFEMGKQARKRVIKNYNREIVWTELLKLYNECLKSL